MNVAPDGLAVLVQVLYICGLQQQVSSATAGVRAGETKVTLLPPLLLHRKPNGLHGCTLPQPAGPMTSWAYLPMPYSCLCDFAAGRCVLLLLYCCCLAWSARVTATRSARRFGWLLFTYWECVYQSCCTW